MIELQRVGRTALFNVVRLSSGFVLIAVLPILARQLTTDQYNLWTIISQAPAYVTLLAAGSSVAIVKMVALADEAGTASVVLAGVHHVRRLASFAVAAVFAAALLFPLAFSSVPDALMKDGRFGVLVVGLGAVAALLATPYVSFFNGIQANGASSFAALVTRSIGAVALVVSIRCGLGAMFTVLGATLAFQWASQYWLYLRAQSDDRGLKPERLNAEQQAELTAMTRTFVIWSVVSLMTSGVDIAVVGSLDFARVGA